MDIREKFDVLYDSHVTVILKNFPLLGKFDFIQLCTEALIYSGIKRLINLSHLKTNLFEFSLDT